MLFFIIHTILPHRTKKVYLAPNPKCLYLSLFVIVYNFLWHYRSRVKVHDNYDRYTGIRV